MTQLFKKAKNMHVIMVGLQNVMTIILLPIIKLTSNWRCYDKIVSKIHNQLYPAYEKLFSIDSAKLYLEEIFLAKYDGNTPKAQTSLEPHVDGSEFSFIIALNNNYSGGGTHFIKQNKTIRLNTGDVVIFAVKQDTLDYMLLKELDTYYLIYILRQMHTTR